MNEPASQDTETLLVEHVLGDLDPAAADRLRGMLAADPALAREGARLQRTLELLAIATSETPPVDLRARVLNAASARASDVPGKTRGMARRATGWTAAAASVAVAALIGCFAVVLQSYEMRREHELQTAAALMLNEPNVVLSFVLNGEASAASASGFVMLDLDARRGSIALRGLPELPAGQSYHLWARLDEATVPCGSFTTGSDGRLVTQFRVPVDSYTSPIRELLLTVETQVDPSAPGDAVVMSSS